MFFVQQLYWVLKKDVYMISQMLSWEQTFFKSKVKVITNGCTFPYSISLISGGSVYNENDTESAKRQAQLEGLKRQCEELDVVIHEFSQYIENTVYLPLLNSLVLQ